MSTVKSASILNYVENRERAYQLISQQIPEDKVLQRNNLCEMHFYKSIIFTQTD